MFGVEIGISDIQAAVSDYMSIPAVVPLVAVTIAMPLVVLVIRSLRSVVGGR